MPHTPPYTITPEIVSQIEQIGEAIGKADSLGVSQDLRLRRVNRIRTIRGSLAIEGNTLSEEQVATLLDGKLVIGPPREILEARNAIKAYDRYEQWDPASETDLLEAHGVLLGGLLDAPGQYRRGGVAVAGPDGVQHVGPPPERVPGHMSDLLVWLNDAKEHPLISSSVFHYEFEFIHPFEDGNGRMGRLWQTLILTRWKAFFAYLPVESLIHVRQKDYYQAIVRSSARGESAPFIDFMLEILLEAVRLPQVSDQENDQVSDQENDQVSDQVVKLLFALRQGSRTAAELMKETGLTHRPTFRKNYLKPALLMGLIEMTRPESPTARNQKYRLTPRGLRKRARLNANGPE